MQPASDFIATHGEVVVSVQEARPLPPIFRDQLVADITALEDSQHGPNVPVRKMYSILQSV